MLLFNNKTNTIKIMKKNHWKLRINSNSINKYILLFFIYDNFFTNIKIITEKFYSQKDIISNSIIEGNIIEIIYIKL